MKISSLALLLVFAANSPRIDGFDDLQWTDEDGNFFSVPPPNNPMKKIEEISCWNIDPDCLSPCCMKECHACGNCNWIENPDNQLPSCCHTLRRKLEEVPVLAVLEKRAKKKGATVIKYKEERDDLLQLCKNEIYQGALVVSEGPHFSFVALAEEPKFPECSMFGFDSGLGQKIMIKRSVDSFNRFYFQDATFDLDDAFQAFDKAKPLEGSGANLATDSCVHFAERIWLELGLPWSEELGHFIVDSVVNDDNFFNVAGKQGGSVFFAASLFGTNALKSQVERVVFSHGARRGLMTSKDYDAPARDLRALGEENGCSNEEYQVDLVIQDTAMIGVFTQPNDASSTCNSFFLVADAHLQKSYIQIDDITAALDYVSEHHGVVNAEGYFTFNSIAHAYEEALVYGYGHENEDFDVAFNNRGDFIAHFFELLGHCSSEAETALIAATFANLLPDFPGAAQEMRESLVAGGVVDATGMSDLEVFTWVVRDRTQNMYCTN